MSANAIHTRGLAAIEPDAELESIVLTLAADTALWTPLVRFAEPRLRIPLPSEPGIEARLLTWGPGQSSGLHDHGGSSGCFMVLRETVWETIVDYDGGIHELTHAAGEIGSFQRDIIHDVRNEGDRGAVTLHAYRPELTTMTKYEIVNGVVRKLDI